jgi:hypothetical protein
VECSRRRCRRISRRQGQVLAPFPVDDDPNMVAFITDHAMKSLR